MSSTVRPVTRAGSAAPKARVSRPVLVDLVQVKPRPGTPIRWCFT